MEKTLRSFYGGSNADLGPVNMDSPPQINDYLRWTGAYWASASFEEPEKNLTETVRNAGFTMLPKGTPVKIVGNTGQEANVIAANATDSFPAHLVLNQDLLAGASGEAVAIGFINNVSVPNASIFTGGQEVYLSPIGGWTTTRPTGTANIQLLGNIVKVNTGANTVSGIFAPQNIEYLPNLTQGKTWVGNSSGLAEEFDLISELNSRQIANTMQFLVASGTAQTIDWNNGGSINLDLSSASGNVTLTLQNPVSGAIYRIRVQQGATVRNLIFPASTVQPGGGGTTYTGIAGTDLLTVYYNGSAYMVQSALNSGFTLSAASIAAAYLALAGGTMTGNLNLPSLNGGSLAGTRNVIINGGFDIWQRGTSFSGVDFSTGIYFADRFRTSSGGAGNQARYTVSQSTDVPNNTFNYSLKIDVTTAEAAVAAGELNSILQPVEGFNARHLIGQTFTLSFWVKSPKTGIHCVAFVNSGQDRSYVEEYTVTAANTWEYKSITVAGGLITAGTWDWTTGLGLSVQWTLLAGTDFHTTKGAWQTGNFRATASQQNLADNIANDFFLAGVQLEPGSVATPFERRSYGQELALCQRYYYENPGLVGTGIGTTAIARATANHPVRMRTAPNVTVSNAVLFFNGTAILTATGGLTNSSNTSYVNIDITVGGGSVSGSACSSVSGTGKITVEAEL